MVHLRLATAGPGWSGSRFGRLVDRLYPWSLATLRRRRVALDHELISARASARSIGSRQLVLDHVDVASIVGRDLMAGRMLLRRTRDEKAQNLERFSIQDIDHKSPADIQKPLVG